MFARLGQWSLWLDEVYTLADALHRDGMRNPLGYALIGAWVELLDARPSELELRLLPAIAGWLGVPLTYWAFRPFAGRRVAAAAALLVALSPWHLHWSQQARFYTFAQDLALGGAGLVLRGLWRGSVALLALGLLVAGLAGLAHPSGLIPVVALVLAPFVVHRLVVPVPGVAGRAGRGLAVAAVLGALVAVPWAFGVLRMWSTIRPEGSPVPFVLSTGAYLTPTLGAGLVAGVALAWIRRGPFEWLAIAVSAATLGGAFALSLVVRVNAQYVFTALPWFALVAAAPVGSFGTTLWGERRLADVVGSRLRLAYLGVLALPLFADSFLYVAVRHGERPRWREAYLWVDEERDPEDLIFGMEAPVGEYYLTPGKTDVRDLQRVLYLDRFRAPQIGAWARHERRIWFVVNFEQLEDWPRDDARELEAVLRDDCRAVARFEVPVEARDLDVWVYVRD